tara:strand:+ start:31125 stop:32114 length:990 start_codon:yes stop_codon:yes gene_type:complete
MRIKNKFLNLISQIPVINNYYTGIATIFTLHRVYPTEKGKLSVNEDMKISPEFLENFIIDLQFKGYNFITLDRLHEILQNQEKVNKQVLLTFDDGYKDNYDLAYPILKKYNIPFAVFLTTSFPEKEAVLWWYIIEDLIMNNEAILLSDDTKYNCKTYKQKVDTFMSIRKKIMLISPDSFLKDLESLLSDYKIDWISKCNELVMTWSQIQELSKDRLVTIASHTRNHYPLNRLNESMVLSEIKDANTLIESKIGEPVNHFAYPFGTRLEINQREIEIVKSINFKTAVTTRNGNIHLQHINYLESLPRIMLTEKFKIIDIGSVKRHRVVTL